jgi:hypothetical protein
MATFTTVRCSGISYRQGFIEVRHGIHPGFINVECWMMDPAADLSRLEQETVGLPDTAVIANTELELSVASARELVLLLQQAIQTVEGAP